MILELAHLRLDVGSGPGAGPTKSTPHALVERLDRPLATLAVLLCTGNGQPARLWPSLPHRACYDNCARVAAGAPHPKHSRSPRGTGTLVGMAPPLNEPCLFMERKRCRLQTLLRLASGSQLKSDTQRHTISKRAFPSFQRCIARCLGPSARQMLVEAVWCYACPVALLCNANVADCTRCCVWHLSHS